MLEIFSKNYRVRRNMIQSRLTQECGEELSKQDVDKVLKVCPCTGPHPEHAFRMCFWPVFKDAHVCGKDLGLVCLFLLHKCIAVNHQSDGRCLVMTSVGILAREWTFPHARVWVEWLWGGVHHLHLIKDGLKLDPASGESCATYATFSTIHFLI